MTKFVVACSRLLSHDTFMTSPPKQLICVSQDPITKGHRSTAPSNEQRSRYYFGGRPTPGRGCCCAHVNPIRAVVQKGDPSPLVIGACGLVSPDGRRGREGQRPGRFDSHQAHPVQSPCHLVLASETPVSTKGLRPRSECVDGQQGRVGIGLLLKAAQG
ncbi:hypothetical protein BN1723_000328 [Verticillium longisporum]|uniref:Uncharacterized protein n=1 Tax=Verticillium longisporum TaxID=100787 RepID=A0A0G4LF24_VERLO|nr:hypothetical protein BN1723_000328 [Verticillium longisporum]